MQKLRRLKKKSENMLPILFLSFEYCESVNLTICTHTGGGGDLKPVLHTKRTGIANL